MIQKTVDNMIATVNAALRSAMASVITRARLMDTPLVVSENGEVVEVNPHHLELPSLTDKHPETSSGHPVDHN